MTETIDDDDVIYPVVFASCDECARYKGGHKCEAFPEKIPMQIITGKHDHKTPLKGDNGILFKQKEL